MKFDSESEQAIEHSLAAVECIVDQLAVNFPHKSAQTFKITIYIQKITDGDEAMVTLYSNYGRGLLKRLEAVDALTRSSPDVAAFIDKCNADLDPVSVVVSCSFDSLAYFLLFLGFEFETTVVDASSTRHRILSWSS